MLRLSVILFIGLKAIGASAQSEVVWEFTFDQDQNAVVAEATIEEGWHLYSQYVDEYAGPIPTSFEFEENPQVELIGTPVEPEAIVEFDQNFESEVFYFKDHVAFKQKLNAIGNTELSGTVTFMICNETMCLPPEDQVFVVSIKK